MSRMTGTLMKTPMRITRKSAVLLFLVLFLLPHTLPCHAQGVRHASADSLFGTFQVLMNQLLDRNSINGASVALFDDKTILWSAAFGYVNADHTQPVNAGTMFSIQSMSKTVTATAVLMAVQEGLLDLDTPVTKYLSDFTVSSCFEEHPEKKITLRLMLGCAAGFTHEAPVGNNFNASLDSYDDHYRSIGRTWLTFPVGTQYSYSNLGFDLAAHVIEKVSGMTFSQYLDNNVFQPLFMMSTSVDPERIRNSRNRAVGSRYGMKQLPVITPMIGAGGVYTSAEDLARFVQMHLGCGKYGQRQILSKDHLIEMCKPIINESYALGISIVDEDSTYAFNHNGGGFGFGASMKWYPEYRIGGVLLTNSEFGSDVYETVAGMLDGCIKHGLVRKDPDTSRFNPVRYFRTMKNTHPGRMDSSIRRQCPGESLYRPEWNAYTGSYDIEMKGGYEFTWYAKIAKLFGVKMPKVEVYEKNKRLFLNYYDGASYYGEQQLVEYRPGLFFTDDGEALDFRSEKKTYRNIELE